MIEFTFPTETILEEVKSVSAQRGKSLMLKNGTTPQLLDESVLTDDDNETLIKYLKQGAQNIAGCLAGYTDDLLDAEGEEVSAHEIIPASATPPTVETIVFRINPPTDYNEANTNIIDSAIQEAIVTYILHRAYLNKGHDFETFKIDHEDARANILFYVNQRKGNKAKDYRFM
jgi:hypothetical protein